MPIFGIMSRMKDNLRRYEMPRRTFAITGPLAFLAIAAGCSPQAPSGSESQPEAGARPVGAPGPVSAPTTEVKETVNEDIVTVEKAKQLMDETADFYISSGFTDTPKEELLATTFFLTEKDDPEALKDLEQVRGGKDVSSNITIKEFFKHYPNLTYSKELAEKVLWIKTYSVGGEIVSGMVDTNLGVTFLNLLQINTFGQTVGIHYTFSGDKIPLQCTDSHSEEILKNSTIHEWIHREALRRIYRRDTMKIEFAETAPEFEKSVIENIRRSRDANFDYQWIGNSGFGTYIYNSRGYSPFLGLEEYAALYIGFKIFQKHDTPESPGYQKGINIRDHSNIELLLSQSGVTDEEFVRLHSESKPSEFIELIVNGAQKVEGESYEERYQSIIDALVMFDNRIDWNALTKYFPGLDLGAYDFSMKKALAEGEKPGCII
jgi:hypothetical protein